MSNASKKYLASLVLFGSNGIVASMIDLPSIFIVLARVTLGAALLAGVVLASCRNRANLQAPSHPREALYLLVSGAALGVAWLFLFEAYRYVGVGTASLLFYCGPVIVMVLSPVLFGARLTAQKLLGFVAVICGAFLVVGGGADGAIQPMGIFLGAMSAVMYAVMVIFSKKVNFIGGVECSALQLCGSFSAVAIYLVGCAVAGTFAAPSAAELAHLNVGAILCIGLVNTGLGCFMYFSSMGELPVTRVAVCGYLEPLSAVVLSAVLLGEPMSMANVAGACLVLGGALYSELGEQLVDRLRERRHHHLAAA